MSDIRVAANEVIDIFLDVMRAQAKLALTEDDSLSPKQKTDAAKAVSVIGAQILDREMPKLTASQQTNINVDVAKAVAKFLPHEQAKALQQTLRSRLVELGVNPDGQHERPRIAECIDVSGPSDSGTESLPSPDGETE